MTHAHTSYYRSVEITRPGKGTESYQVDHKLAELIKSKQTDARDGRISTEDALDIVQAFKDGGRYGKGESPLYRGLRDALDDRTKVVIDGVRIRITDPAEKAFSHGMQSFFGGLAGKGKVGSGTNTQQAAGQFGQQIAGQSQQAQESQAQQQQQQQEAQQAQQAQQSQAQQQQQQQEAQQRQQAQQA